jgi:ABC-type polar amino acid transport system ATPase subunit
MHARTTPTTSNEPVALQPQMASMLAQTIQGQQQHQEDVAIARALAKTPRTVSEHFKI